MKKISMFLIVMLYFLPTQLQGQEFMINGLCYYINNDGVSVSLTFANINNPYSEVKAMHCDNKPIVNLVVPETIAINGSEYKVSAINQYAFKGYRNLETVTLPNSVTSIGDYAFCDCRSLTSVKLGNSISHIGKNAFDGCSSLKHVEIPDLSTWCRIKFDTPMSNPLYRTHSLSVNGNRVTNLIIPNSIDTIKDVSFVGCLSLQSITIPTAVKYIGVGAFAGCIGLNYLEIPGSVATICPSAFEECKGLEYVKLGDGITSIGKNAFKNCRNLMEINLPQSIRRIEDNAFASCTNIKKIVCYINNPNSFNPEKFLYYTKCELKVPMELHDIYRSSRDWNQFFGKISKIKPPKTKK